MRTSRWCRPARSTIRASSTERPPVPQELEKHSYDVLIIGAGGAGLRAAISAHEAGLRVAIICKSLFGKAHTVMAEGGCAAAMGNANSNDNWQGPFRDTLRGGKVLKKLRGARRHGR